MQSGPRQQSYAECAWTIACDTKYRITADAGTNEAADAYAVKDDVDDG